MASYTPGTEADAWVGEEWAREIDVAAYKKAKIYPNVLERDMKSGKLHIPKHANVSVQKPADTVDLSSLTFNINTETEFTMSPGTATVPLQVNLNTIVRMMKDPDDMLKESIEKALAQQADQDVGGLASTAVVTNVVGNAATNIDESVVLEAYAKGANSADEYWEPGEAGVVCCIANLQIDNLMSIPALRAADVRGDAERPVVTGFVSKAFGVKWYSTGNLPAGYSLMFIPRALAIGWNQAFTVLSQPFNLVRKLIGWGDYAYGAVRENYCVAIRHLTT